MKKKLILLTLASVAILAGLFYWIEEDFTSDDTLTLYGNVDVRQVNLGFRVPGRVNLMPFEEGDLVRVNDIVGELDPQPFLDQVREAKAQVSSIKVDLANAEKTLVRRLELVDEGSVSKEDLDNAQTAFDRLKANLEQAEANLGVALTNMKDTRIFAPTEGTILTRIREPGSVVASGDPIYSLSISDPVWVRAFVSEPNLGKIFPGMRAKIYTDSDQVYDGHIGFISPVSEFTPKNVETTKLRVDLVYRIRVVADNPNRYLKQGMPVTVKLYDNGD
ncbi:MAG: efflux RND transporter periplasmic adaptor subunit [Chlamydiia bacterium]|nr:efflux RND transporter periplasmic adaptor subunit [Chlamydiia bacterium]